MIGCNTTGPGISSANTAVDLTAESHEIDSVRAAANTNTRVRLVLAVW
jgi:hypothetical protein